jgi:flagellar biosynthesis/type III secretory pathway M-ring protein FliF/YscJ
MIQNGPVIAQAPPAPEVIFDQPWMLLGSNQIFALIIVSILVAGAVLWPLMRALGRRLEGGSDEPELGAVRAELEDLRRQVASLADVSRVAELEERVDFAERLLAQQHEPVQIESRNA